MQEEVRGERDLVAALGVPAPSRPNVILRIDLGQITFPVRGER